MHTFHALAGDLAPYVTGILGALVAIYLERRRRRQKHSDTVQQSIDALGTRLDGRFDVLDDRLDDTRERLAEHAGILNTLLGFHETPRARAYRERQSPPKEH